MKLPNIKIGLLNITWTNGSRNKPLNPIPVEIIAQFEDLENTDINWINNQTGLITLKGDYNYLIFDNNKFYSLEKNRILDINQSIFVYTLTLDVWQTFINNPSNELSGCLVKTSDESILWEYLQYVKLATININSEQILLTNKPGEEGGKKTYLTKLLKTTRFKRNDKDEINQFGYKKRFVKSEFNAFKEKLINVNYASTEKKPNQLISYCPLRDFLSWENYVAKLVEDFLTTRDFEDPLILGTTQDLKISSSLNTKLNELNSTQTKYTIHKKDNIFTTTVEEQRVIRNIDLSGITEIQLIDNTTLDTLTDPNILITEFKEDPTFTGIKKSSETWFLKNRFYSPIIDPKHYTYLNTYEKAFKEDYLLNTDKLIKEDIKSLTGGYKEHKYDFVENYVPALYWPNWATTITNTNIRKAVETGQYNVEIGFLLYKFGKANNSYFDFSNQFVYRGGSLWLTTGLRAPKRELQCLSQDLKGINTGELKDISFKDIYREDINKSFWLTLWSVYLWQGQFDRVFEKLSPDELAQNFSYTVGKCVVDDKGEVIDLKKQGESKNLPSYGIDLINPGQQLDKFKQVLKELTNRREDIEINTRIYHPSAIYGDILWNETQSGFFSTDEIKFNQPCLVVFGDTSYKYTITDKKITVSSLKNNTADYGYKFGFLDMWQPEKIEVDENNLITQNKELPRIGTIRSLLTDYGAADEYDYERFVKDIKKFVTQWDSTHPFSQRSETIATFLGIPGLDIASNLINELNFNPRFNYYDTWGSYIDSDYFDWSRNWPQHNGKLDFIKYAASYNGGFNNKYTKLYFENYKHSIKLDPSKRFDMDAVDRITNYVNKNLTKESYRNAYKSLSMWSWDTIQQAGIAVVGDKQNAVIGEVYSLVNKETIKDNKFFSVNEEYIKTKGTAQKPLIFSFKKGGTVVFYAVMRWNASKQKTDIELIISDQSLIIFEPAKQINLIESVSIKNTNLVQVMNQRNFLYVRGEYIELQTKILNNTGKPEFSLKIENINVEDPTTSHYRVFFDSEVEHIKKYITIAKLETKEKVKILSDKDWLNYKLEKDYREKSEEFERELNQETERLTNLNFKNRIEDLNWEKGNFNLQNLLNAGGQVSGGLSSLALTKGLNPLGLSNIALGAAGAFNTYLQQARGLEVKTRDLQQADIENAFKISHAKNTMDERHKNAEMRERLNLYKLTHSEISKIPNTADILEKMEENEGILNGVCIFNRIPTGALLEYLTQFHINYGFDITANNINLSVENMRKAVNGSIYQFSRIDTLTITDLQENEQIRACFLNGVFLVNHKYELSHTSYLQLRQKHLQKVAAEKARVLQAQKELRAKELEEIAAVSKGVELAKTDYKTKLEEFEKCDEELREKTKELEKIKRELETDKERIEIYKVGESHSLAECLKEKEAIEASKLELENAKNEALAKAQELEKKKDKLEEAISTEKQSVDRLLREKQELDRQLNIEKTANKELSDKVTSAARRNLQEIQKNTQLTRELEELKKKPPEGGEDLKKAKEALEELAKKKTKLEDRRELYKKLWQYIVAMYSYDSDNKGYYNYIVFNGSTWKQSSGYYLTFNYEHNLKTYIGLTASHLPELVEIFSGGVHYIDYEGKEEYYYPLLPKDLKYTDKTWSKGVYEGSAFFNNERSWFFEIYISNSFDYYETQSSFGATFEYEGFERVLKVLRDYCKRLFEYSAEIRKIIKEIADYLRTIKYLSRTVKEAGLWNDRQHIIDAIRDIKMALKPEDERKFIKKFYDNAIKNNKDWNLFEIYAAIWESLDY